MKLPIVKKTNLFRDCLQDVVIVIFESQIRLGE